MPRVQENAPGILPSRSISLGSRISTITTSLSAPLRYAAMASVALMVSISALASSIIALMPRVIVWGIGPPSCPGRGAAFFTPLREKPGPTASTWAPALQRTAPRRAARCAASGARDLSHQLPHGAFQTLDGDRVHTLGKQPANDGGGFRIVPMPRRNRIE